MNVTLRIDGTEHHVPEGQSLAALLLALQAPSRLCAPRARPAEPTPRGGGEKTLGRPGGFLMSAGGTPRTPFCGMGVCGECRVTVDGEPAVLACLTACRDGLVVSTR